MASVFPALGPIFVGDTHDPLQMTWERTDGTFINLSPGGLTATLSVRFGPTPTSPAAFSGTGTFVITNAAGGQFTYQFSNADLATGFRNGFMQFTALYQDGTKKVGPLIAIVINPAI